MYVAHPTRKNGMTEVRIIQSYRVANKVKKRIIKTIGRSKDPSVIKRYIEAARSLVSQHRAGLICLAKVKPKKLSLNFYNLLGKDRYNHGFEDILGSVYDSLGFSKLISTGRNSQSNKLLNDILKNHVLMRLFSPSSKLKSCELIENCFKKNFSYNQVLNMMDHLYKNIDELKGCIFHALSKKKGDCDIFLFDVTTLHFESTKKTDLKDFGYSKDGKFNEVQVVLAVLANQEGMPLAYEVFSGNTAETKTFKAVLDTFVKKYNVRRVRVTADRAMFSENNFKFFESLKSEGIEADYLISCPLRRLPQVIKEEIFEFKKKQLGKKSQSKNYYCFTYKERKIYVSFSEERRSLDEKKRQRKLDKINCMTDKSGRISNKKLQNKSLSSYLDCEKGSSKVNEKKVFQDSLWDGLYGVCTNIEGKKPEELFTSYRNLWKIEEVFRIQKHTLEMRPIYHRLSQRIKAHILMCFLAYTSIRHTENLLKKEGLFFSPRKIIEILKDVESFVICDKIKNPPFLYFTPKESSQEAQQIYKAFKKECPITPYLKPTGK